MSTDDSSARWRLEKQAEQICDSFEAELRAGEKPSISEYLERADDSNRQALLEEMLALELEYFDENAIPWSLEQYLERLSDDRELVHRVVDEHCRRNTHKKSATTASQDTVAASEQDTDPILTTSLVPGSTIGQYVLEEEIGSGGMGVVFRARQTGTDRLVALKFVNALTGSAKKRKDAIERFIQEPKAAAKLEHDNIVTVYEVGRSRHLPYFSMQLIAGASLRELTGEGPLACRQAATYVKKIAAAIQHAHDHHILHRDIKPANILLGPDDRPYITDFGMAKSLAHDLELTQEGTGLGTVEYVSPEQAASAASADERSDVYSLGATLYCLVTGRPPFQEADLQETLRQVRDVEPVRPSKLNPRLEHDLEIICLKCLAKHPADRYASARDLALDLEHYLNGEPITARPIGPLKRIWRWGQRHRLVAGLSLALAGILVALGVAGPPAALYTMWLDEQRQTLTAQNHYESARLASQRGEWRLALEKLQLVLDEGYPDPIEVQLKQIHAHHALGEGDKARKILEKLLASQNLGKHEAEILLLAGNDALKEGTTEDGLARIRQALTLGLEGANASYAQGLLATDSPGALAHFRKATELDPFHHDAHGALVFCEILLGHLDDAAARSAALTHLYPDDPSFAIALAWIAAVRGDLEQASAHLEQVQAGLDEATYNDLQEMCDILANLDELVVHWDSRERWKVATELLALLPSVRRISGTSTLRLPPSLWPSGTELALLPFQLRLGPNLAAKTIERALEVHPEGTLFFIHGLQFVTALEGRGPKTKRHTDQLVAARDSFLAASRTPAMFPSINREALYPLGMCEAGLSFRGMPDELANAVKHLREYRDFGPFPKQRLSTVIGVAFGAGDLDFAQLLLLDMEECDYPNRRERQEHRANLVARQGDLAQAVSIVDELVAESPENKRLQGLLEVYKNQLDQSRAGSAD